MRILKTSIRTALACATLLSLPTVHAQKGQPEPGINFGVNVMLGVAATQSDSYDDIFKYEYFQDDDNDETSAETYPGFAYGVGFQLESVITPSFGVLVGVNFMSLGSMTRGSFAEVDQSNQIIKRKETMFEARVRQNLVTIPIMGKFYLPSAGGLVIGVGLEPTFGIGGSMDFEDSEIETETNSNSGNENVINSKYVKYNSDFHKGQSYGMNALFSIGARRSMVGHVFALELRLAAGLMDHELVAENSGFDTYTHDLYSIQGQQKLASKNIYFGDWRTASAMFQISYFFQL